MPPSASAFYSTPLGGIDEKCWEELIGNNLKEPLFKYALTRSQQICHHLPLEYRGRESLIAVELSAPLVNRVPGDDGFIEAALLKLS